MLGIVLAEHPRTTVMVPKAAVVTVLGKPVDGERMVDIRWNDRDIMVFAQDLRERAELVNP